jgi:DNA repair photolyase
MEVSVARIRNILTRASGYLAPVTSHSAQPYRGCAFGNALCGAGCYVQHNTYLTRGQPWGAFLEVRENAAASYLDNVDRERRWAQRTRDRFGIFLSSSTEPFMPHERHYRVTEGLLAAMSVSPPDLLIVQTHSHRVADYLDALRRLDRACDLRVHISIETDREHLPGLPPHASAIERRFEAARALSAAGLFVVITVSPLLPIADPERFFARIARSASACVLDHFVGGDGSPGGRRTRKTPLPAAMEAIDPTSVDLGYRDRMVQIAARHLTGRVGVEAPGFAGRYLR